MSKIFKKLEERHISLILAIIYLLIVIILIYLDEKHDVTVYIFLIGFLMSNAFHALIDWWNS